MLGHLNNAMSMARSFYQGMKDQSEQDRTKDKNRGLESYKDLLSLAMKKTTQSEKGKMA